MTSQMYAPQLQRTPWRYEIDAQVLAPDSSAARVLIWSDNSARRSSWLMSGGHCSNGRTSLVSRSSFHIRHPSSDIILSSKRKEWPEVTIGLLSWKLTQSRVQWNPLFTKKRLNPVCTRSSTSSLSLSDDSGSVRKYDLNTGSNLLGCPVLCPGRVK